MSSSFSFAGISATISNTAAIVASTILLALGATVATGTVNQVRNGSPFNFKTLTLGKAMELAKGITQTSADKNRNKQCVDVLKGNGIEIKFNGSGNFERFASDQEGKVKPDEKAFNDALKKVADEKGLSQNLEVKFVESEGNNSFQFTVNESGSTKTITHNEKKSG